MTQLTLRSLDTRNGAPFDTLEGTVSSNVTSVSLALSDGQSIQATVNGGLVLAWWPNGSKPVTAQVTSASGTTTQSLDTFGPESSAQGGLPDYAC